MYTPHSGGAGSISCFEFLESRRLLAATAISADDKAWLEETDGSELFEVTLGNMAQTHAHAQIVRNFAARLVHDHTLSGRQLDQIALNYDVTLPKQMSTQEQDDIDRLSKLDGVEFDQAYTTLMISDHHDDIASFSAERNSTQNSTIKTFASSQLPVLRKHLSLAHKAADFSVAEIQSTGDDTQWLGETNQSELQEIILGNLAQTHGSADIVKRLGARMVSDHTQMYQELQSIATSMDVTLPQVLDAHLQKHVDQLKTLSGTEFDRAYASFMVGDHHDDIASFKQESQQTRNSQLEDFTKSNLPVLIKHLNLARHAWAAVKA